MNSGIKLKFRSRERREERRDVELKMGTLVPIFNESINS
jgi:hypothetical protein